MIVVGYTEGGLIRVKFDDVNDSFVPDDMLNRDRQVIADWEAQGNTIPPYVPPDPPINLPEPKLYAILKLEISGDAVTTIDISAKFSGAVKLDVGLYMVFFA